MTIEDMKTLSAVPPVIIEYFRECRRPLKGDYYEQMDFENENRKYKDKSCEVCQYHKKGRCHEPGCGEDREKIGAPISNIICCGHPYLHVDVVYEMLKLNKDKLPELYDKYVTGYGDDFDLVRLKVMECTKCMKGSKMDECINCYYKSCKAHIYFKEHGINMEELMSGKKVNKPAIPLSLRCSEPATDVTLDDFGVKGNSEWDEFIKRFKEGDLKQSELHKLSKTLDEILEARKTELDKAAENWAYNAIKDDSFFDSPVDTKCVNSFKDGALWVKEKWEFFDNTIYPSTDAIKDVKSDIYDNFRSWLDKECK